MAQTTDNAAIAETLKALEIISENAGTSTGLQTSNSGTLITSVSPVDGKHSGRIRASGSNCS